MSKGLHVNQLGLDNGTTSPTEEGHVVMNNGEIEFHDGTGVVTLSADVSTNTTSITTNANNITALSAGKVNKDECETCTFGLGNITLSGEQTLNGVLTSGSRVIVVEQTADADNGIYVTAAGAWTRATDFDLAAEMVSGSRTMVLNPASDCYRDTFVMYSDDVVTVDTDPVLFTRIPALDFGTTAGTAAEGNDSRFHDPVTLAGSPNYLTLVGQVLTRALINLTSHVTGILPVLNGGTGASTVGGAQTALGIKPNALEATDIDTFAELDAIVTDATLAKTTDLHDAVTLNAGAVTQESANLSGQEIELVASTTTTAGVMSAADKLKLDNIATGANNYTHPNHTGEVTSVADGAQTLDPTAITNKTAVSVDGADYVLISDDSDAGNLKKVLASEFLAGGGTLHDRQAAKLGGSVSTAVDTYALVGGMTLTTGDLTENGDYIVNFRCQWDYSNKGQSACWFILYLNGAPVALTEQVMSVGRDQEGQGVPFSATYSLFNVAAGSTIEIHFKESSSGLFSVYGRELSIDGIGLTNTL